MPTILIYMFNDNKNAKTNLLEIYYFYSYKTRICLQKDFLMFLNVIIEAVEYFIMIINKKTHFHI